MRTVFRERSSRNRSKLYILLDVLVCSIAEYFNDLCRILTASKQTRSLSAHFSHGGKSKADREASARCRLLKQVFYSTEKPTVQKTVQYRRIFVLYWRIICTLLCAVG